MRMSAGNAVTVLPILLGLLASACAREPERLEHGVPSVVLIVADDLGWGEVGYHGARQPTPHIDALARAGVQLDGFYATPICSATRAALLTGRDPIRYGLGRAVVTPWRSFGLDPVEVTLPEILGQHGYAQRAAFGKWHLGHLELRWHPLNQGFTRFRGHYTGAIDYFTHERDGERDWHEGFEPLVESGYSTELIAAAAADFIHEAAPRGPFFCYVAFNAVHPPLQATPELLARFAELAAPDGSVSLEQMRAAMIAGLDDGVGRILAALDSAGVAHDSLVWFLSDNGAGPDFADANRPLRGNKLTLYEGGLRVPAAVRWPRGLPAGVTCEAPLGVTDVLPTLLQALELPWSGAEPLDGRGVLAQLRGAAPPLARDLYFYYGQDGPGSEQLALRREGLKLIVRGPELRHDTGRAGLELELYDLRLDPFEEHDIAALHPERVDELLAHLRAYRQLQPEHAVAPFWEGSQGFVPPRDWRALGDD